ncbi:MAG: excinuclease ABC subunit UvrC [Gemmatimonadaceae bacterium]|nr:excinuclease ABC subunit UvrC [Gemmatimonadaceae bacterium]
MPVAQSILDKVPHLPESPGVYLWRDAGGHVVYVGKAKRLRSRVRSYVTSDHRESVKTRALMLQVESLDTIVVPTEAHALVLEANLIKEYKPRFNIALRDDKSYPYIKVTVQEPFPRVWVTRRLQNDGARYFGPYTDVGAMRRALDVVKRLFTVRSCNYDMPAQMPERPCLDYHIGRCKAPCVLAQTQGEYGAMIDEVVDFLGGRPDEVVRKVRERMELAAESLDFERAAQFRDALAHLETMGEPTIVMEVEGGDRDVVGYARDGDDAVIALMRIRGGRLLARDHQFVANVDGEADADVLETYLAGPYRLLEERAHELILPFDVAERTVLEESLERTRIHVPQRGPRRELVEHAQQNARHLLEEARLTGDDPASDERAGDPVYELQRQLGLATVPRAFVCFDISHAQGTDTVASMVWFQNGRPYRNEYRKFKVRTVQGIDDFASMHEVVDRYFARRVAEEKPLPDLVVIDGGKGQLNAAADALRALGLASLPIVSLAKREEEIFVLGRTDSIRLSRRSPSLRMLQQARDEAHRFAITFQRKRRAVRTITSELLRIPGIGDSRRRLLLTTFGSVQAIRDATAEQIAAVPGFSVQGARRVLDALRASDAVAGPVLSTGEPVAYESAVTEPVAPDTTEKEPVAPEATAAETVAPVQTSDPDDS